MIRYHASAKANRSGEFHAIVMVRNERGQMIGSKCSPHAYADKVTARNYARIAAFRAAANMRSEYPNQLVEVA